MSDLLSVADLERVTGLVQGAAQMRYFQQYGLRPMRSADGHPVITWQAVNAYIMGTKAERAWSPDLSAIRKAG